MEFEETSIQGVWIGRLKTHHDVRGSFQEWFKSSDLPKPIKFEPLQANSSVSKRGVIRGIHFSLATEGQRKLITCVSGSIRDFYVDLRRNSETFMKWGYQDLSANSSSVLFLENGIGHAFQALEDFTVVTYLLDSEYNPKLEYSLNPFDENIGLSWSISEQIVSARDLEAPTLRELIEKGMLPK